MIFVFDRQIAKRLFHSLRKGTHRLRVLHKKIYEGQILHHRTERPRWYTWKNACLPHCTHTNERERTKTRPATKHLHTALGLLFPFGHGTGLTKRQKQHSPALQVAHGKAGQSSFHSGLLVRTWQYDDDHTCNKRWSRY